MNVPANPSLLCPNRHGVPVFQGSVFCNVCGAPLIADFRQMPNRQAAPKQVAQRYTTRQLRWVGLGLLLGAFLFLFLAAISAEAGVLGLFLFVGCLVPGLMMLGGFFGEPAGVASMREAAIAQGRQTYRQAYNIAPREFRYKIGWFANGVLIVMFTGFFLAGILFLAVAIVNPGVRFVLVIMGLFFIAFGGLGLLYVYRTSQLNIKINSWGLKAVTLFDVVEIAWNEVVTLEGFDIRSFTYGSLGKVYKVYSLNKTLEFSQKLENCKDLISAINYATQCNATTAQGRSVL